MDVYANGAEVSQLVAYPADHVFMREALHAAMLDAGHRERSLRVRFDFDEGYLGYARTEVCAAFAGDLLTAKGVLVVQDEIARVGYDSIIRGLVKMTRHPSREDEVYAAFQRIRIR